MIVDIFQTNNNKLYDVVHQIKAPSFLMSKLRTSYNASGKLRKEILYIENIENITTCSEEYI